MSAAYYSENDPYAAAWLRNLVAAGLVPAGDVDDRDIRNVHPDDLRGYEQVHCFAGIGGWAYAARLVGWPDDRALWTGSAPCQPFSVAGRGLGTDDERHLWPDFFRLIRAARPAVVMGEQVAGSAGYGWFDGVRADLAGAGYASRAVDIPACAVDAPHIRSRLYWIAVADRDGERFPGARPGPLAGEAAGDEGSASQRQRLRFDLGSSDDAGDVAHAQGFGRCEGKSATSIHERGSPLRHEGTPTRPTDAGCGGSAWAGADWIACHDGKSRRTAPGIPLLAHGIPGRVALWRGFGNAICAPLAAEVIAAFMEVAP